MPEPPAPEPSTPTPADLAPPRDANATAAAPSLNDSSTIDRRNELMREFLTLSDERCPSCTYQLRQLTGTTCPECGETLTLRVGSPHACSTAFIVGLIGLALPVGLIGIPLMTFLPLMMFHSGRHIDRSSSMLPLHFFVTLVACLPLFIWLGFSRRIQRSKPTTRALLDGACWLAPIISVLILYMMMTVTV